MVPQIACLRGCILTLVTFAKQFCNVLSIESSRRQATWMRNHAGCTCLILFSTVRFQMCPEGICLKGRIITLIPLFSIGSISTQKSPLRWSMVLGYPSSPYHSSLGALAVPPELCGPLVLLYLEYIAPPLLAKD